ncbi:hypothetical protein B0A49_01046 [Cryomyces minteri]|uniref:Glycosyltransferase family 69 protein n=1 Tax=Cryomyces minteri TaxID=331657 RepID=A0A4U0XWY8_9PEZI|nr:hypothetical protein B0A49_01046 [Cryomyces minteri]
MICLPSYTHAPAHYDTLRQRTLNSNSTGSGNINNEKVFIAASIYDKNGGLTGGLWGQAVLRLVNILGPENVFLSIYENDPDPLAATSLKELGRNVRSNSSVIAEHVALDEIPHITLPTGGQRLKRIEFLADVRNRALRPLDNASSSAYHTRFDKLLYLNDVIFDPIDAANLLFSTNVDSTGHTQYRAACAVDFGNAFKFYDTFATRDLEGHSMGIPFFPWFTNEGNADSRQDVLDQKDAVRVCSCWGGMIAFEAKWFQTAHPSPGSQVDGTFMEQHASNMTRSSSASIPSPAIRFRAEEDLYWESSECCLIHADIQPPHNPLNVSAETGIYMNPYIRVAYDPTTYWWLSLTRRPERLYPMIHRILNPLVGLPRPNPRRTEEPGQEVIDKSWVYNDPNWELTGNLTGGYRETCLSGIACVLGASIICVDLVIRHFPGKRNFRIQDSNVFLSSALSLSFGVMLFSSLYSMLPSAKSALEKGGLSPKEAAWTLVGCFLAGVIGIQIVSRVLHAFMPSHTNEATPLLQDISEEDSSRLPEQARNYLASGLLSHDPPNDHETGLPRPCHSTPTTLDGASSPSKTRVSSSSPPSHEAPQGGQHHHHVPTNAFLSIGLQTSIAIALHKLPEGFITYATNHANPSLGFAVFLALFIHNITEGFAMALPLYLAIGSRPRAMFWSSLLGGFSQPCGAAVAALWFRLAGSSGSAPGEEVYGAMFAVTAGIMASVALQLFSESLDLTHNRGLCMGFAFVGMGVLGVSSALTA